MLATRLQPWIPVIIYAISSLGFVVGIAFWRTEIFQGTAIWYKFYVTADLELFLGLDNLSHRLQEEGSYGYGVIFLLIWVTTFRESRANRRSCIFRSWLYSAVAVVLDVHHPLWLHVWGVDGSSDLVFRSTLWGHLRLRSLPGIFPGDDRVVAIENDVDPEGGACDREAAETSVYGSPGSLPI